MEFLPGKTVGIDLGTTFSAVALLTEEGKPVTIPNKEGGHITHSVVWLGDPTKAVVGAKAYQAVLDNPEEVCQAIKREMGNSTYRFEYGEVTVTPEAISAMILRKLKLDTEERLGEPVTNAVITVPAYFNDSRRKATMAAGAIAGFNVLEIINEPTAATLTYAWLTGQLGLDKADETPRTVVVYDLGGGTFDVTAVRYQGTDFRVLATDGDIRLGGLDWTRRLVDDVAEQLIEKGAPDLRKERKTFEMLSQRCEVAKRSLSIRPRANVQIKVADENYIAEVRRDSFEAVSDDLMQRTRDTIESVLEEADLTTPDVDEFILVGGSTRMVAVIDMMREIAGKEPYTELSPDEAVAEGAAIHAAILEAKHREGGAGVSAELGERLRSVEQSNVNSHSLGILARDPKTRADTNAIMIPRNTPIPCSKTQKFVTREVGQDRVRVRILEGDAPDPDACYEIGQCLISELPTNLPAGSPIEVTYSFDTNGCIQVHAKDVTGGKEAKIEILRTADMERTEVSKLQGVVSEIEVS